VSSSVSTLKNEILSDCKYNPSSQSTFYDMQRLSNHILLTGYNLNLEVQQFLDENIDIPFEIPKIVSIVNRILSIEISPSFELIEDQEDLSLRRLAIIFTISDREYDAILNLWNVASREVYQNIDISTAKKIAIILDGE
jgi:hypothetical protein